MKNIILLTLLLVPLMVMSAGFSPRSEINFQDKQDRINLIDKELMKSREFSSSNSVRKGGVINPTNEDVSRPQFFLHKININTGDERFYNLKLREFVQPYLETKVGKVQIYALVKSINAYLYQKGYVTSTVSITPSNLKSGVLDLYVSWGRVAGFLINEKLPFSYSERMLIKQNIPISAGDVLNIHDIDQAMENINNYHDKARIDILPSSKEGYSYLNIILTKSQLPKFNLSIDNSGMGSSPKDGLYRYSLGSSFSNVLFGSDTLNLKFNTRHLGSDSGKYNYFAGVDYSIPLNYTNINLKANASNSGQVIRSDFNNYSSKSYGQTYSARIARIISRNAKGKFSIYSEIERRRTENYINAVMTSVNSYPYSDVSFGAQYTSYIYGGGFFSDFLYNRGVSLFDGKKAAFNEKGESSNYDRIVLDLSWQPNFNIINHDFSFTSHLNGQYSRYHLLDIYRLVVGDEYTVRGYKDDNFYGDSGLVLSNTLSFPSALIINLSIVPFVGLDGSYLEGADNIRSYATGGALGIKSSFGDFDSSLTIGKPFSHSQLRQEIDPYTIYWNVSMSL